MIANNTWPPPYQIRYSNRAKRLFLQITRERGLEVVLPLRKRRFDIERLIEEKRSWIEKALKRIVINLPNSKDITPPAPTTLDFLAIPETWQIVYHAQTLTKKIKTELILAPEKTLQLKGNTQDTLLCYRILKKYLIEQAHGILIPWIESLSLSTGLLFNRIIIRGQSTLWGSCNAHKTISLNYKLLFLPKSLVQHVLLHELCHTKYLNHSARFWAFLKQWDQDCEKNRRDLKTADSYVPRWINSI